MFKLKRGTNRYSQVNPQDGIFQENFNSNQLYPNYQNERLIYEIKENRRRINNLAKRIVRLENYLRIRDTSDYNIIEDNDEQLDNDFSHNYKI